MSSALPFPDTPEAIDAAWMTAALAGSVPGAEVTGLTILDQHSGTTGRLRLGLDHGSGAAGPASVFVKLPPFDEPRGVGSKWQPIEVGMLGMTRATDACADLDTLGALRERL